MDLLLCLARHAGETVSKETILEEVWEGAFVVEGVIPKTISALRAALGDDAANPAFILTVPRRGYRLVAKVGATAPGAVEPTGSRLRLPTLLIVAGGGLAVAVAAAVLVSVALPVGAAGGTGAGLADAEEMVVAAVIVANVVSRVPFGR